MSIRSKKIKVDLEEMQSQLSNSMTILELRPEELKELQLVGPVPVFNATPARSIKKTLRLDVQQVGWRGVITSSGVPIVCVNFHTGKTAQEKPTFTFRGRESAVALNEALKHAIDLTEKTENSFSEIRFISLASIYVTAVWLYGKKSIYIPTRIDAGKRPKNLVLEKSAFLKLVEGRFLKKIQSSASHEIKSEFQISKLNDMNSPPKSF